MRIVCPDCTATYDVPDRLSGSGKRLRCARCAHEWMPPELVAPPAVKLLPAPVPPEPEAVPMPEPERRPVVRPAPVPRPELHAEPKPRPGAQASRPSRMPVALALLGSVLVLAGILAAGVIWRGWVMQQFPPSALLFRLLGLA